jgi:hypothetical protein
MPSLACARLASLLCFLVGLAGVGFTVASGGAVDMVAQVEVQDFPSEGKIAYRLIDRALILVINHVTQLNIEHSPFFSWLA